MSIAEISFAGSALGDLTGIQDWYAAEGVPEIGDRLVAEIFQRVEMLADHPDIGRIVPECRLLENKNPTSALPDAWTDPAIHASALQADDRPTAVRRDDRWCEVIPVLPTFREACGIGRASRQPPE